jgi:hypothetical protein
MFIVIPRSSSAFRKVHALKIATDFKSPHRTIQQCDQRIPADGEIVPAKSRWRSGVEVFIDGGPGPV